jgi:hypothetical protein
MPNDIATCVWADDEPAIDLKHGFWPDVVNLALQQVPEMSCWKLARFKRKIIPQASSC